MEISIKLCIKQGMVEVKKVPTNIYDLAEMTRSKIENIGDEGCLFVYYDLNGDQTSIKDDHDLLSAYSLA